MESEDTLLDLWKELDGWLFEASRQRKDVMYDEETGEFFILGGQNEDGKYYKIVVPERFKPVLQ